MQSMETTHIAPVLLLALLATAPHAAAGGQDDGSLALTQLPPSDYFLLANGSSILNLTIADILAKTSYSEAPTGTAPQHDFVSCSGKWGGARRSAVHSTPLVCWRGRQLAMASAGAQHLQCSL